LLDVAFCGSGEVYLSDILTVSLVFDRELQQYARLCVSDILSVAPDGSLNVQRAPSLISDDMPVVSSLIPASRHVDIWGMLGQLDLMAQSCNAKLEGLDMPLASACVKRFRTAHRHLFERIPEIEKHRGNVPSMFVMEPTCRIPYRLSDQVFVI
jgi:hypothetical protein